MGLLLLNKSILVINNIIVSLLIDFLMTKRRRAISQAEFCSNGETLRWQDLFRLQEKKVSIALGLAGNA